MQGLTGTILRVNLNTGEIRRQATPQALFARFLGARGVGAYLLYHELPPHIDPLSRENKLIFLTSPLTGTLAPGANKITVTFRSPLSETYSFSACGGHLAPELKFAGYDGLIVEGRAAKPVYLLIQDSRVEIRDAAHLWGKLVPETDAALRAELGDPGLRIACIGPAGEKGVRFASIHADLHREFGRGGPGAVMGTKNLKAIAVRGTGQVSMADPGTLAGLVEAVYADLAAHPKAQLRRQYGTPEMVSGTNDLGFWATRNFTSGHFEAAGRLSGPTLKENLYAGDRACFACPIACGKISPVVRGPFAGSQIEGPEFETTGLLGPNCGVDDPADIVAATAVCDAYGFDTMSAGVVASFAMEAYESGLLDRAVTGGLDLRFGNGQALVTLMEWIGQRYGLGDLLAEGSRRAARHLGADRLAMQVKGQELATYEPRGVLGMGLSYAISPKGGHHMIAPTMGLEVAGDPSRRLKTEGKAAMVRSTQFAMAVVDSLGLCSSMRFVLSPQAMLDMYRAVTGLAIDAREAERIGESITNLERLFNVREGFGRAEDTLPDRLLHTPLPAGPGAGSRVPLDEMLEEYYRLMGWDTEGVPTQKRLDELGLTEEAVF